MYSAGICCCPLFVRPSSVTGRYCIKTAEWIELVFFDTEGAIGYPALCYKGIRLSSKIMVLPSESLALPLNFADFSARKYFSAVCDFFILFTHQIFGNR